MLVLRENSTWLGSTHSEGLSSSVEHSEQSGVCPLRTTSGKLLTALHLFPYLWHRKVITFTCSVITRQDELSAVSAQPHSAHRASVSSHDWAWILCPSRTGVWPWMFPTCEWVYHPWWPLKTNPACSPPSLRLWTMGEQFRKCFNCFYSSQWHLSAPA